MDKVYSTLKKSAQRLRKQGKSYGEIKRMLGVSKSTLSFWLKDVLLSPEHRSRLYTKQIQILSLGPKSQKERRAKEIERIIKEANKEIEMPLSKQTLLLMGAALYWAEGSKGNRFQVTNSDPVLIAFMIRWIKEIFGITAKDLKAKLNIYPQQNDLFIQKFWSNLTGIPLQNFLKSYVKPMSTGYKKNNLYYGTIRIEVPKSSNMCHRTFGWINAAVASLTPSIRVVEQKWRRLKEVKRPINLQTQK